MTTRLPASLAEAASTVLACADPADKAALTHKIVAAWRTGELTAGVAGDVAAQPARPDKPELLPPAQVPRRRINSAEKGRVALLHALAHIELNAIDLAWDIIARFAAPDIPHGFYDDWVRVADEEAKHFSLLAARLVDFDAAYGDLPAHDGLWEAAIETRHDLAARLAVVPLVLEARGLDVTPAMIEKLRTVGDDASAEVLEIIYREEIGHVRVGKRWFEFACACRGCEPAAAWRDLVAQHFRGLLKPPFNVAARDAAGLPAGWYMDTA